MLTNIIIRIIIIFIYGGDKTIIKDMNEAK